jgi:hypothetical protein
MKEQELIDLGFEKIEVTHDESDNGYDYYYYELRLTAGLILSSCDNIEVKNKKWIVSNFDWPLIESLHKNHIIYLTQMVDQILNHTDHHAHL